MTQAAPQLNEEQLQEMVETFINSGLAYKDLRGLGDKDMEAIYSLAYTLYNHNKYDEALKVFKFLSLMDHTEKKYFLGLAACRQMLGLYDKAVEAYQFAAVLDVDDPTTHLRAADCLLAAKRFDEARSALHAATHWAGDEARHKAIKERAEMLLNLLPEGEEVSV